MNQQKPYLWGFLWILFFLSKAATASSADYSQAVSLFDTSNYQAALPLFQQVVQDDPANAKAYYYLGSCQEKVGYLRGAALNDYLSNHLSPDPKVKATADKLMGGLSLEDSDWVEQHLDQFSVPNPQTTNTPVPEKPVPSTPVPTVTAPMPPTVDYSQAVSLFSAGDYQGALPLLQKAVQEDPGNAQAYSYLGTCEQESGKMKEAALDYYISNQLVPNPQLEATADQLAGTLAPYDRNWVRDELASWKSPAAPLASSNPSPQHSAKPGTSFGIRFSTGMSFFNLADFQSDLNGVATAVQGFQAANPSYQYRLQTSIASNNMPMEMNPYFRVGPNTEFGMIFGYWPSTSVSYSITDIHPQYFVNSEYDFDSFEMLLMGRFYFPKKDTKGVRFFLEPTFGIQPIDLHRTYTYANTTLNPSSDQTSESLGAVAFNGGLQLGGAFTLGPSSVLSLSVGYQFTAVSGFEGTWSDAGVAATNGAKGSVRLYTNPSTGQSFLVFVPDDPNQLSAFGENTNTVVYSRPLSVDESGFRSDIDLSFNF